MTLHEALAACVPGPGGRRSAIACRGGLTFVVDEKDGERVARYTRDDDPTRFKWPLLTNSGLMPALSWRPVDPGGPSDGD